MIWFSTLSLLRNAMKGLIEKPLEINGKTVPYITDLSPTLTFVSSVRKSASPKFTEFGTSELTAVYLQLPESIYFLRDI